MRRASLAVVLLLGGLPAAAASQDIEAVAAIRGVPLPPGYYARVADDPDFFEFPNVWRGRRPAAAPGADPVSGVFPLIVIPALFADSDPPMFSPADIQRTLFDGPAPSGTATEFYWEASGGLLTVSGVTTPWVRTSITMAEVVGTSAGIGTDSRVAEYLAEALALADGDVDFALFDNDGPDGIPNSGDDDGFVDAVTFEFHEVSASCGGPAIWPHRSSLANWTGTPYTTGETRPDGSPILVNGYIIQGVTDCSGTVLQTANVISHEFGHVLGLPDLYHPIDGIQPESRRWVLGCWALMAAGTWGCDDPFTRTEAFGPTHFSPWSKDRLGWIDWIEVGDVLHQEFTLRGAQVSRSALMIPLDGIGREFLVVEFRPQEGFDAFLPASGVLVYHWDLLGVRRPDRGSGEPYLFALEEADGRTDLRTTGTLGGNRGQASDAWGVGERVGPMNSLSLPSTQRHADDRSSTVTIHSFEVAGDVARVRITTAVTPAVLSPDGLPPGRLFGSFEGRLLVAGGSLPYSVALAKGAPASGLTVRVDGEDLVVEGAPVQVGQLQLPVILTDSRGSLGESVLTLTVGPFMVSDGRLVEPFVLNGEVPLTELERGHLDAEGNGNGLFDIGDARAHLRRSASGSGG